MAYTLTGVRGNDDEGHVHYLVGNLLACHISLIAVVLAL